MGFTRIMVPLDGSEIAESVLFQLPRLIGNETLTIIDLVRVVVPLEMHFKGAVPIDNSEEKDLNAAFIKESSNYLDSVKQRLEKSGIHNITTTLLNGPVSPLLLNHLETSGADLLLIATHGRSGFSRWIMGSVADKLLRLSRIPVLLVRPQNRAFPEELAV